VRFAGAGLLGKPFNVMNMSSRYENLKIIFDTLAMHNFLKTFAPFEPVTSGVQQAYRDSWINSALQI